MNKFLVGLSMAALLMGCSGSTGLHKYSRIYVEPSTGHEYTQSYDFVSNMIVWYTVTSAPTTPTVWSPASSPKYNLSLTGRAVLLGVKDGKPTSEEVNESVEIAKDELTFDNIDVLAPTVDPVVK